MSLASLRRRCPAVLTAGAIVAASVTLAAPATAGPTAVPAEDLASRFTLGILPDTQFYSRYATPETGDLFEARYGSEPFAAQTTWLAQHAEALNMPFVTHLGDVVDRSRVAGEWTVGSEAMAILERAGVPYSILPGNHDLGSGEDQPFRDTFTAERAAQQATFGGRAPNGLSEYHVFEAEGQEYLVLALEYQAGAETLAWAQGVLDANPSLPAILTAHENLGISEDRSGITDTRYGKQLWDGLIAGNDQIFLTLSGHNHGAGVRVQQNDAGNDVVEILMDYQMAYQGGNGLMGVLELDLTNDELQLEALSPWVAQKPAETLTAFDDVVLPDAPHSWTLPLDFSERFAGFAPGFAPGDADDAPLADLATSLVTDGYEPHVPGETDLPADAADYPVVEGTVAHWRPAAIGAGDGATLPVGTALPDVAGANDMTRAPLDLPGVNGAQEADVRYSAEGHPLSSDGGSITFTNTDRAANRLSFFATGQAAPVNDVTFEDGYTIETFVKIDEDWTGANAWMAALTRGGSRTGLEGTADGGGEPEAPPATLAFSSLQEFQWSQVGTAGNTDGTSAWSHEIPLGEWVHVALVNDPEAMTVTMYVDGAPILRNVIDSVGLAGHQDVPWLLGTGGWDGAPADGFLGSIGETRFVDHALTADEWLTARADEPAGKGNRPAHSYETGRPAHSYETGRPAHAGQG